MITELANKREFDAFIKEGTVLVDFFADWCMPCVMMAPVIEELSEKFRGKIKFGKVDVNESQELSQRFRVVSIPNFILFKDGEIIDRFVGAISEEDFEEKLKKYL